jgi:cytochrome c-type biogenesis protein
LGFDSVTIPLALAAGAASFLSPCVLPLVPAYLAFLSHSAAGNQGQAGSGMARWRVVRGALGFTLGLGIFCVAFFYVLDRVLEPSWRSALTPVLGVVVILLGLGFMGVFRIPLLAREARWLPTSFGRGGFIAGVLLGLGLAAGWTPCIGPVLGAVLTSGLNQGTTARGTYLMVAYAVGLGLPFLVAAVAVDRVGPLLREINRHQRLISVVGGVVIVAMGALVLVDHFTILNDWLSAHLPAFFQDPFNL